MVRWDHRNPCEAQYGVEHDGLGHAPDGEGHGADLMDHGYGLRLSYEIADCLPVAESFTS